MSRGRRRRAPTEDGAWLVDPPWSQLPASYQANVALQAARSYDVQGLPLTQLVEQARTDLVRDALHDTQQYRDVSIRSPHRAARPAVILAGHQPELFHPGVWAKNFALARLAQAVDAVAVNLIIDGDTLKTASLRVPTGTVDEPYLESVPFDAPGEEVPYEERRVVELATYASFGERAAAVLRPFVAEPLLRPFWPKVVARHAAGEKTLGACFAQARHQWESSWGLQTLEYRQSRMCETLGFRRFALHLLAQLPRFWRTHNSALADYRRREHIRSANHPVPALEQDDDWLEAPLWLWTTDDPRRRRVFVRRAGRELELTDWVDFRARWPLAESADAAQTAAAWNDLAAQGVKLRSKALLTTMYARLVLGDLFLHGIGGGKYDELTDEIIRQFFGFEPPAYAVVTATRRLPIALPPHDGATVAALEQELWELAHHPERFLTTEANPSATAAIAAKRRWTETTPTRETARERCHAIRDSNAVLRQFVEDRVRRTTEKLAEVRRRTRGEALLTSREFSSFLFPEKDLREFLLASPPDLR